MSKKPKVYNSIAQWKEHCFPEMEKEKKYDELKKDAGLLGSKLANESIDKIIRNPD